jgi:tetratricopeptide (TPR) repeat protein
MRLTRIAFTIVYATMAPFAHAADLKKTGPLAPSESLIAARVAVDEPALEFSYAIGTGAPQPTPQPAPQPTPQPTMVTFDLAKDYSVADNDRMLTIYDYALKRVLLLDDKGHSFRNLSLYAVVASSPGGADATFEPSKQALDKDQAQGLAKLLRTFTPLSPAAIARIQASGYLPQTLSIGTGTAAQSWTLQSSVKVTAAYPLMASARPPKPDPSGVQKAFGDAAGAVMAAGAGQGAHTQQDLRADIEKALAAKHPFQGLLLSYEMMDRYGSADCAKAKPCHSLKAVEALAARDPRSAVLRAATNPKKGRLQASIAALKAMKRGDLTAAYMLDDLLARDLVAAGRKADAMPLLISALKAAPTVPVFYKDLGDLWRANGEPALAWDAYDLGRIADGTSVSPATLAINGYEAGLEEKYPELF